MKSKMPKSRDIVDIALHMAARGMADLKFNAGGGIMVSLTPKGKKETIEFIGGQDIADVAMALTVMLATKGDAIGIKIPEEAEMQTWQQMIPIARVWRALSDVSWNSTVRILRKEFLGVKK